MSGFTDMNGFRVRKLGDTELVSYGPKSDLRVFIGDEEKSTAIRTALQTCQPGYDVPFHCHPYIEYLIVMQGSAVFRIESEGGQQTVELQQGDTVELHAGVYHAFTTSASEVTQLLGIHLSPERITDYRGMRTDGRGYRVADDAASPSATGG